MIFNAMYSADLNLLPKLGLLPFIILGSSLIVGVISYILLKASGYSKKKLWSVLITVVLGNTGFISVPVSLGVFGYQGLIRAIFCDISSSVIFLILSFVLVFLFGGTLKKALKKILLFPPLWAIIFGILFNLWNIQIGPVFDNIITYLAGAAIPLIMISLGVSIKIDGLRWNKMMVIFTSIMKLLVFPLVTMVIVIFFRIFFFGI